jgi:AcrR family transcriptional regulator
MAAAAKMTRLAVREAPAPLRPRVKTTRRGRVGAGRAECDSAGIILNSALDLFAKRGFHAVTIKDIAAATGLNTALIYYYFDSKEDLFRRAVEFAVARCFEEFSRARAALKTPDAIIAGWLQNHIDQFELIQKFVKISVDYASVPGRVARIDRAIADFYDEERRVLAAAIREGVRRGLFRAVDVEQTTAFISTFLDGVMVRAAILKKFDVERSIRDLRQAVFSSLRRVPASKAAGR